MYLLEMRPRGGAGHMVTPAEAGRGTSRGRFISAVQFIRPLEGHLEGLFCVGAFGPQRLCCFITSAEKALQRAFVTFPPLTPLGTKRCQNSVAELECFKCRRLKRL